MRPLDLRTQRLRGPREKIAGLVFTARVIDKLRSTLPGGNEGPYFAFVGISEVWARYTKIDLRDLRAVVEQAASENEVEAWIEERIVHVDKDRFNARFDAFTTTMVPDEWRTMFEKSHPEDLRREHLNAFDLLEADDQRFHASLPE